MDKRILDWVEHPISKILFKILKESKDGVEEQLDNIPDDAPREVLYRKIERKKVYKELLDIENLFRGELE